MAFNLLETVKNHFSANFVSQVSSRAGETPAGISKALSAIIPASLAGILNKATSGSDGAGEVYVMAKNSIADTASPSAAPTALDKGNQQISSIFGINQAAIISAVSGFAGIKDSSASSLMAMGIPAILGILGKHAEENNQSASGLAGFLSSQKENIVNAMPSGLTALAGLLGMGPLESATSQLKSNMDSKSEHSNSEHHHSPIEDVRTITERRPGGWLVPLIVIVIIVAGLFYFSRSCNETKPSPATVTDTTGSIINYNPPRFAVILKMN